MGMAPTAGFRAIVTDASGHEVLTFDISARDRFILSFDGEIILNRKLSDGDRYWSKETLAEVVREMTLKID